jgi:hypothetical protein
VIVIGLPTAAPGHAQTDHELGPLYRPTAEVGRSPLALQSKSDMLTRKPPGCRGMSLPVSSVRSMYTVWQFPIATAFALGRITTVQGSSRSPVLCTVVLVWAIAPAMGARNAKTAVTQSAMRAM